MGISPTQLQIVEGLVNGLVAAFYPAIAPYIIDAEEVVGIATGVNPPTVPTLGPIITNSTGAKYGLYVVPMGAAGTTVTITF
jgi:hypothetical protein